MSRRSFSSLPMYDLVELVPQTDRLYRAITDRLADAGLALPADLGRSGPLAEQWRDPGLVLSQSCGYPLLSLPRGVRVVATPCYRADGCDGASYRSALVVRDDDPADTLSELQGRRCVINAWDSNSGMNLLRAAVAPLAIQGRFFGEVAMSGSHARSLALVTERAADLAAIDCVTLALLRRHRPRALASLRILGWTADAPGLPLITAGSDELLTALRKALSLVETDPGLRPVLDALLIDRFAVLPHDAYERIAALEHQAIAAGYPVLQ